MKKDNQYIGEGSGAWSGLAALPAVGLAWTGCRSELAPKETLCLAISHDEALSRSLFLTGFREKIT